MKVTNENGEEAAKPYTHIQEQLVKKRAPMVYKQEPDWIEM